MPVQDNYFVQCLTVYTGSTGKRREDQSVSGQEPPSRDTGRNHGTLHVRQYESQPNGQPRCSFQRRCKVWTNVHAKRYPFGFEEGVVGTACPIPSILFRAEAHRPYAHTVHHYIPYITIPYSLLHPEQLQAAIHILVQVRPKTIFKCNWTRADRTLVSQRWLDQPV